MIQTLRFLNVKKRLQLTVLALLSLALIVGLAFPFGGEPKDKISHVKASLFWAKRHYQILPLSEWDSDVPLRLPSTFSFETEKEGAFFYPAIDPFDSSLYCPSCYNELVYTEKARFKARGRLIKTWRPTTDTLVLYSLGPNRRLDLPLKSSTPEPKLESFQYDPTNGARSAGDILVVVKANH